MSCEGAALLCVVSRCLVYWSVSRAGLTVECECGLVVSADAIMSSVVSAIRRLCFAVSQTGSGLL